MHGKLCYHLYHRKCVPVVRICSRFGGLIKQIGYHFIFLLNFMGCSDGVPSGDIIWPVRYRQALVVPAIPRPCLYSHRSTRRSQSGYSDMISLMGCANHRWDQCISQNAGLFTLNQDSLSKGATQSQVTLTQHCFTNWSRVLEELSVTFPWGKMKC